MKKNERQKLFFFPSEPVTGYQNPYCNHFKDSLCEFFDVIDNNKKSAFKRVFTFIINSFKADVFIVNWLESVIFWRHGFIQFILAVISLFIVKRRKKKIIYMLHNKHPHDGKNIFTEYIQKWMFENASVIISHSKETAEYAKCKAKGKVLYLCHPVAENLIRCNCVGHSSVDIFIWGAIVPYKGIAEFLSSGISQNKGLSVKIIGKCKDPELANTIYSYCTTSIIFENRHADYPEIACYCRNSKYVLFPYVGDCVSSSGALIETIVFGGTPIGPDKGAFKDLSEESVCITYRDYDELSMVLGRDLRISLEKRERFIKENSWSNFIHNILICLQDI